MVLRLTTALACAGVVSGFGAYVTSGPGYEVASLSTYPGYEGWMSVTGVVVVTETDLGISVSGTVNGLEPSVWGGLHIHEGTSCDVADDVGGHYYEGMSEDPWTTTYDSDSIGTAMPMFDVADFTLDGAYPVSGRAIVVHAEDGTRVACGVLQQE